MVRRRRVNVPSCRAKLGPVPDDLAFEVHALAARLDRAAARLLRSERDVTYRRFLVLYMVGELGVDSQRALAQRLDVSEPSVSRMTAVLKGAGWLTVTPARGARRHELALTPAGRAVMEDCQALLSERLDAVVARSGVPAGAYVDHTRRLSRALDEAERSAAAARHGRAAVADASTSARGASGAAGRR